MHQDVVILIAEDDEGHATLITKNLRRSGIGNAIMHFKDGQEMVDFLFGNGNGPHPEAGKGYLMLLDIRMPRLSGIEVLEIIKEDPEMRKIPIIMLTTSDDPREIERCHLLGCSNYIPKPIEYDGFVNVVKHLGLFLSIVQVPVFNAQN
jgi:CheY-like chemotaxis protein